MTKFDGMMIDDSHLHALLRQEIDELSQEVARQWALLSPEDAALAQAAYNETIAKYRHQHVVWCEHGELRGQCPDCGGDALED